MMPRDPLLETWWTLLLLPLLLLIPWARRERPTGGRRAWLVEAGLATACGLAVVGLCGGWLVNYHLVNSPITCSDFSEYCQSIAALRGDAEPGLFSHNRSRFTAFVPGLLARHLGIIDGLAFAALGFTALVGAGMYAWGRALHGRLAGLLTVPAFCAVGPLVVLPRTLSLYSETMAIFVWASAGTALALRYRTWPAILMGGVGAGLCLLAAARGLFWALPVYGLTLLACIPREWRSPKAWRKAPLLLALATAPVALSYPAGTQAFQPSSWTLEQQLMGLLQDRRIELGLPLPPTQPATGYLWGYSSPLAIPGTLLSLVDIQSQIPAEVSEFEETVWRRAAHIERWYPVLAVCLALSVAGLVRRPWQLAALLGTLLPFAVALRGAGDILVFLRFVQTPMGGFPVVMAVGVASLMSLRAPVSSAVSEAEAGRLHWRTFARPAAAVTLCLLFVVGVAPSWLSPVAPWRFGWVADAPMSQLIWKAAAGPPTVRDQDYACHQALWRDYHEGGHPPATRLYGLTP